MTAFTRAVGVIFANPDVGVDGTFLPAAGGSVAVRVIWSRPDELEPFGQTGVTSSKRIAEIQASEVAAPLKGDSIQIPVGGSTYKILADPRQPDPDRRIWRLELGAPI